MWFFDICMLANNNSWRVTYSLKSCFRIVEQFAFRHFHRLPIYCRGRRFEIDERRLYVANNAYSTVSTRAYHMLLLMMFASAAAGWRRTVALFGKKQILRKQRVIISTPRIYAFILDLRYLYKYRVYLSIRFSGVLGFCRLWCVYTCMRATAAIDFQRARRQTNRRRKRKTSCHEKSAKNMYKCRDAYRIPYYLHIIRVLAYWSFTT